MPDEFNPIIDQISKEYPAVGRHLRNIRIQRGDKSKFLSGGSIEFFPSWEKFNPNPGQHTIEIYDKKLVGDSLKSAITGDALHLMGGVDPITKTPYDPGFRKMKEAFSQTFTPQQVQMDLRNYNEARKNEGETRSFDDWLDSSRTDAYIRGYLFPDERDEWRKQGIYTPDQTQLLENIKAYLLQNQ